MPRPIIHDGETQREMTANEYAEYEALCDDLETQAEAAADKAAAAASGRAKLAALGLTHDEINALLGA